MRNNSKGALGVGKKKIKGRKKEKKRSLLSFQFTFNFSWKKSPLIFFFKFNASWEHAVQDFGMGTSNEAGKAGKCVSGKFEEAGSGAGSQPFVRSTPSHVSTKREPTRESEPGWPRDPQHLLPQLSPRGLWC